MINNVCSFLSARPPNIPPNADVTYNLELLEVSPPVDFETITEEELISLL